MNIKFFFVLIKKTPYGPLEFLEYKYSFVVYVKLYWIFVLELKMLYSFYELNCKNAPN